MYDNVLYIIGNGFDRHHDVQSGYSHFSDWLKRNNRKLYDIYSSVCHYDGLWSDFENGMAYVDRDYLIGAGEFFLSDYSKDPEEWQAADIFMAGEAAREHAEELVATLKQAFHKWIKSLRVPKSYPDKKIYLDYDARFLTFNYTEFLESEYGVSKDCINYIHGHRTGGKSALVVGHGGDEEAFDKWWNAKQYSKKRINQQGKIYRHRDAAYKVYRSQLPEYEHIAKGIQEYFEESRKPVEQILQANAAYFEDLYDIQTIYVLGFSFNQIDLPYINRIIESNGIPEDIRWFVSYLGEDERLRFTDILNSLGINVEAHVTFTPMSSWQIHK